MIVVAWFAYCVVLAVILLAAAAAWESAARWSGRSARGGWLVALAGSVSLPWLLRLMPERGWTETIPAAIPAFVMEPFMVNEAVAASGVSLQGAALMLWAVVSALLLSYVAVTVLMLVRARRNWRRAELDGSEVLVAPDVGPAALGLRRGVVVMPAWALELDGELRSLLVRHERAHVEAGDPRLVFAGLLLVAAMPWNPVVWVQFLRLRNAIEFDCDARVLAGGADPHLYGSLLLEVGLRRGARAPVMATLTEPRMFLAARIRRIAHWPLERNRGRSALFTTAALLLIAGALSCDPIRVTSIDDGRVTVDVRDDAVTGTDASSVPEFTPFTRRPDLLNIDEVRTMLEEGHPPLLKGAGIGGRTVVFIFIDTAGVVRNAVLRETSGYDALDAAALRVAGTMRFTPAYNRLDKVPVWIEIPIVFSASAQSDATERPQQMRARTELRTGGDARQEAPPRSVPADRASAPGFTPFTVKPELRNAPEVRAQLVRHYPPLLRDAGIGGSTMMWILIDEEGNVVRTQISESSGYDALDHAAQRVAGLMKFSPALNRDERVQAWIELPVVFTAR